MKRKFIPVSDSFLKWKKDPAYVSAYDSLEGELAPASSLKARIEADRGIRDGLEDLAAGRTRPARKVFDEFRKNRGISR
jgi:hypothetical protein